ncbi:MAG: adenosylmethionine--8-amino-7-oxononanoate transaminase [Chlamydiales bacterium]|nr:adenosylmethionine--8-amino-7-oxononanoate transaminase [Chlamydiales bacterium]
MLCPTVERDLKTIWHPFTQRGTDPKPLPFIRGAGSYLYTPEGVGYLDAISSWWVNLHGHAHPVIAEAISKQAGQMDQVLFTDFTHSPAIELSERLLSLLPEGFSRVFFTDDGSTAVEAALKMAIQYWHNRGIKKRRILSLDGGYHGDTFGAMSAAGKNGFNFPFWPYQFEVETIGRPFDQNARRLLDTDCACLIYEPRIQGAGGMRIYPKEELEALLNLCRQSETLLIADEVMTGFGRTGPLFASSFSLKPDFICLSKGITGGALPLGVTVTHEEIYEAFLSNKRERAFLHGHSYTANPICCAAANASLTLFNEADRKRIEAGHRRFCFEWEGHPKLKRLEYLGTILALEFNGEDGYYSPQRDILLRYFLERKILLRPLGNVIYAMPPYCTTNTELEIIYGSLSTLLNQGS